MQTNSANRRIVLVAELSSLIAKICNFEMRQVLCFHPKDDFQNGYFRVELCQTTQGTTTNRIRDPLVGSTHPNGGDERDSGCGQTSSRALGRYCVGGGVGLRKSA